MKNFKQSPNFRRVMRAVEFLRTLMRCSKLMKSPLLSYNFLRSRDKNRLGYFQIGGLTFCARRQDWMAVSEVLIEDEYSCIDHLFESNESPRILDLGANIGSFAIRTFLSYRKAQVVSVEAAADTFLVLEENKKSNSAFTWEVINCGVWRDDSLLNIMRKDISLGHRVVEGSGADAIQGISLSTILRRMQWDQVDLIKMDIEGGEEVVIPSALDALRSTRFLIIEVHSDRFDSAPIMESLKENFIYHWRLNDRKSQKPLLLMTNESCDLGSVQKCWG